MRLLIVVYLNITLIIGYWSPFIFTLDILSLVTYCTPTHRSGASSTSSSQASRVPTATITTRCICHSYPHHDTLMHLTFYIFYTLLYVFDFSFMCLCRIFYCPSPALLDSLYLLFCLLYIFIYIFK